MSVGTFIYDQKNGLHPFLSQRLTVPRRHSMGHTQDWLSAKILREPSGKLLEINPNPKLDKNRLVLNVPRIE